MSLTKQCTKCDETKPLEDFHIDKKGRHGRRGDCVECVRARGRSRSRRSRGQTPTTTADSCNYPSCRRDATASSGLCADHHTTLSNCRESPLALTGGQWVPGVGGVRRWVA